MMETNFLDNEEQELIGELEKDGWKSSSELEDWKTRLSRTASNTLAADHQMDIRVTKSDLDSIKLKAIEEGIPYQTFAAGIIHK